MEEKGDQADSQEGQELGGTVCKIPFGYIAEWQRHGSHAEYCTGQYQP